MIDDLQTLCTASLRRLYTTTVSTTRAAEGLGAAPLLSSSSPLTPIDPRAVTAFFESLEARGNDNTVLRVESAHALAVLRDRLAPDQQRRFNNQGIQALMSGLGSYDDPPARDRAKPVVRGILQGELGRRRDFVLLEEMVNGVTGDDPDRQAVYAYWFALVLNMDEDCPRLVQNVVNSGILPRFVELLQNRNDSGFHYNAVSVLLAVLHSGTPDQTMEHVVDHGAIPVLIRLLQGPHTDDPAKEQVANWFGFAARRLPPDRRDLIVRNGAVPPLLAVVLDSPHPHLVKVGTWALDRIFEHLPASAIPSLRPALPALARLLLLSSPGVESVTVTACGGWARLADGPPGTIQAVFESAVGGVPRRLVELLAHPSPKVQTAALNVLGNIAMKGTEQHLQTILDLHPLPALLALLSCPDGKLRGTCCWVLGNLASSSHERIQLIIDHGIVPPLLRCLADANSGTRKDAARAVGTVFTGHGTPRQVWILVEAGCLPLLCDVLADLQVDAEAVSFALEGVENTLVAGGSRPDDGHGPAGRNAVAARIASDRDGMLAKIRALTTREDDDDIRARATLVLTTYLGGAQAQGGTAEGQRRRTRSDGEDVGHPSPPLRRRSRRS